MDRLEAMTILLRVADRESFSAASRELGIPLATVSRKVNELEAHLGTKLLLRTTRKVALTDAGAVYVASARRILDEIDETERVAAGEFQSAFFMELKQMRSKLPLPLALHFSYWRTVLAEISPLLSSIHRR
jgi:DNA-binding transcriptional LysR family regulator